MSGVATASLLPDPPRRRHDEADLQASVMAYLAWALPPDAVANHSPGEGKRTKRARGELKRSGYQAGWPDIEVIHRGRSIFLELKAAHGVLSPAQRNTHRRLEYAGCPVMLCRSLFEVECALRGFGLPLRASVAA